MFQVQMSPPMVVGASTGTVQQRRPSVTPSTSVAPTPTAASKPAVSIIANNSSSNSFTPVPTSSPVSPASSTVVTPRPPPSRTIAPPLPTYRSELGRNLLLEHVLEQKRLNSPPPPPAQQTTLVSAAGAGPGTPIPPKAAAVRALSELPVPSRRFYDLPQSLKEVFSELLEGRDHGVNWEEHNKLMEAQQAAEGSPVVNEEHDEGEGADHIITPQQPSHALPTHHHTAADIAMLEHLSRPAHHKILKRATVMDLSRAGTVHLHADTDEVKLGDPPRILRDMVEKRDKEAAEAKRLAEEALKPSEVKDQLQLLQENSSAPEIVQLREELAAQQQKNDQETALLESEREQRQEADRIHEAHLSELSNPTPVPLEIVAPVILPVIPFELQGDLELYNSVNVEKRIHNKFHPDFVSGVQKFWLTFDSHEMGTARQHHQLIIPRGNFIRMLVLAYAYLYRDEDALEEEPKLASPLGASMGMTLGSSLEPPHPFATSKLDVAKLHKALTADIKADVHQRSRGVTFVEFHEAMFQLVDQWTVTVELVDYVSFLELLYEAISRPSEARVQSPLAAGAHANKSSAANSAAGSNRGGAQPNKPKKNIPRWGVGPDGSPILLNEDELDGNDATVNSRSASRVSDNNTTFLDEDENILEEDIELDANGQRRLLLVEHERTAAASHTNSTTITKRASWIRNGSVTRTPVLGQRNLNASSTASPPTQTTSLKSSPKTYTASILTGAGLELLGRDARDKVLEDMGSTYNSPTSPSRRAGAGWKLSLVKGDQSDVEKQQKSPPPRKRSLTSTLPLDSKSAAMASSEQSNAEQSKSEESSDTPITEANSPEDRKRDRLKAIVALTWSSSVTPGSSKPKSSARPSMSIDVPMSSTEEKQSSPSPPSAASRMHTPGTVIANLGESLVPYDPMRLLSHIQVKHSGEVVRFQSPLRKTLSRSRRNSLTNITPRPSIDATNIIESRAKSSGWGRSPPPPTQVRTPDTVSIASTSTSKATSRLSTRPSTRDGPRPGTADSSLMVPSYSKPTSSSASRSPSRSPTRSSSPSRTRAVQQVLVPADPFVDPLAPGSTAPLFARRGSIPTPAPRSARQKQLDSLREDLILQAKEIEKARAARLIVKVGAAQSAVNSDLHTDPGEIARLKAQLQQLDQTQITSIYGMAALSMSQQKQQREAAAAANGSQSARGASRREANFIEPPLTARAAAGSSLRGKGVSQPQRQTPQPTVPLEDFRPWTASTDGGGGGGEGGQSVKEEFERWQCDSVRSMAFTTPNHKGVIASPSLPTTTRKNTYTIQWEQSHRASRRYRELLDAQLESDTHTNVVYRNCMFDAPPKAIRPRDGTADKSRRDELWYATLKARKMDSRAPTRPSSSFSSHSTETADTNTGLGTIERVLEQNNSLTIRTNRPGSTHRPQSRSGGDIGTARCRFDTNQRAKVRMGYVDPTQSFLHSAAMISKDQPPSPTARLTIVRPNTAPMHPHSNDLIGFADKNAENEGEQTRPLSPVKADVHSVFKHPLSPYPPPHYRPFVNTSLNDVPRVQRREHVFTWKGLDQAEWGLLDRDQLHRAPFQAESVPLYLKGALFTSVKPGTGRVPYPNISRGQADAGSSLPVEQAYQYDAATIHSFDTSTEALLQQSPAGDDISFEPVPGEVFSV